MRRIADIAAARQEQMMERSPRQLFGSETFLDRRWCITCGRPFQAIVTNDFHRYCSQRCGDAARSRRKKEEP